jgi:cell fate regulator YaaT (PSP1 superfamily)
MADIGPFVSVKLSISGRPQSFLLSELQDEVATPAEGLPSPAAAGAPLQPGDQVVVETGQGSALGEVTVTIPLVSERRRPPEDSPRRVTRRATREDVAARFRHEQREHEARQFCGLKIRELGLSMKLTKVEQLFDGSRIIFYYTAEERVDFRELVRELAAHFRTRIEMRQIGVRDEAKMLGGYGPCGQPLCCSSWLTTFDPVTIKMAKQQNLSLNPSRLSGMCGRLKCCLRYEIPNGKGVKHGGCAESGGHGSAKHGTARGCGGGCSNPTGPGGCGLAAPVDAGEPPSQERGCGGGPVPPKHDREGRCGGGCGCRG